MTTAENDWCQLKPQRKKKKNKKEAASQAAAQNISVNVALVAVLSEQDVMFLQRVCPITFPAFFFKLAFYFQMFYVGIRQEGCVNPVNKGNVPSG